MLDLLVNQMTNVQVRVSVQNQIATVLNCIMAQLYRGLYYLKLYWPIKK